jgi:glucose-1-phosphate cytidylyltransferase
MRLKTFIALSQSFEAENDRDAIVRSDRSGGQAMKVVVLAGGFGTRLAEETDLIPKPMVPIGGLPILWHIMKLYSCFGLNEFVICLGYKGYMIKEYFFNYFLHRCDVTVDMRGKDRSIEIHESAVEPWRVTLVDTGLETMTGGRLRRVRRYLEQNEPFCLTYGDGLSNVAIDQSIAFHRSHGRKATVTAIVPPGRFGVLQMNGDKVEGFAEKPEGRPINGGFFVLDPCVIDYIEGDETIWEREPLERLATDDQLRAFAHDGFWQPMDTLRDKRMLEELWTRGKAPWKLWE